MRYFHYFLFIIFDAAALMADFTFLISNSTELTILGITKKSISSKFLADIQNKSFKINYYLISY